MTEPTAGAVFGPDELAEHRRAEFWVSETELDLLTDLESRAKPGPWRHDDPDGDPDNRIIAGNDEMVAGNYDYEVGGIIDADDTEFIIVLRNMAPRLAEALRSAWDAQRKAVETYEKALDQAQTAIEKATDRADLLNHALADAARHIGDSDALNRANAVLRADTDGKLSPRHTDAMGVPQFCDDAERDKHALARRCAKRYEEAEQLRAAVVRAEQATAEALRKRLADHYLAQIICDHDRALDNPVCACSLVHLGWHPSVGAAVAAWIDHALAADVPAAADEDARVREWYNAIPTSGDEEEALDRLAQALTSDMLAPNVRTAITTLLGDGVTVTPALRQRLLSAAERGRLERRAAKQADAPAFAATLGQPTNTTSTPKDPAAATEETP